jgi:hypothetical protein
MIYSNDHTNSAGFSDDKPSRRGEDFGSFLAALSFQWVTAKDRVRVAPPGHDVSSSNPNI